MTGVALDLCVLPGTAGIGKHPGTRQRRPHGIIIRAVVEASCSSTLPTITTTTTITTSSHLSI